MAILCKVLHHFHDDSDLVPTIQKVRRFAAAADKYDCIRAPKLFMTLWISRFLTPTADDYGGLMVVAYQYDDHAAFASNSRKLLSDWTKGFSAC